MDKFKFNVFFGVIFSRNLEGEDKEFSIFGKFKVTGILVVGKEVSLFLMFKNMINDRKTVTMNMIVWIIVYNGIFVYEVWKDLVIIFLDFEEGN